MKLEEQLKTALDETRMQMLGVQILFGFQFQSVFQSNFAALSRPARVADALALALILLTFSLLVAPPAQHRLVEKGEATTRMAQRHQLTRAVRDRWRRKCICAFPIGFVSVR